MDKQQQQHQGQESFIIVSTDESFLFYDSLVRRVWIVQDKRPIVRVTGLHQRSCVFGAVSMEKKKKQLFRQYDIFVRYVSCISKKIHAKFQKCYLFMDKASPHYTYKKVIKY